MNVAPLEKQLPSDDPKTCEAGKQKRYGVCVCVSEPAEFAVKFLNRDCGQRCGLDS